MILAASYCRVSTDKDDQANSFEAQQRYFKEYIDRQPDWELYRVYADEGIIGYTRELKARGVGVLFMTSARWSPMQSCACPSWVPSHRRRAARPRPA